MEEGKIIFDLTGNLVSQEKASRIDFCGEILSHDINKREEAEEKRKVSLFRKGNFLRTRMTRKK